MLQDRLPPVRGSLTLNAPLAPFSWFRVGGPADALFRPADSDDLAAFLAALPTDIPVTVIGATSNLLIRDGGIRGVVIRLSGPFAKTSVADGVLTAGAACPDMTVAQVALQAGLAGLEFLSGIPGTIGGALRMNAGAYGRETKDVLIEATAIDRQGKTHILTPDQMGMRYRHTDTPADFIFTAAQLSGTPDHVSEIKARMEKIAASREASQPIRSRTGGSTFANPDGQKSWQLIDAAGCRGLRVGDAEMSTMHCNFLINRGAATAHDIETLGEEVRRRVKDQSGIDLRWEIKRIGDPAPSLSSLPLIEGSVL
jgi:UDP-N-acetylmuramate dehydrogenase